MRQVLAEHKKKRMHTQRCNGNGPGSAEYQTPVSEMISPTDKVEKLTMPIRSRLNPSRASPRWELAAMAERWDYLELLAACSSLCSVRCSSALQMDGESGKKSNMYPLSFFSSIDPPPRPGFGFRTSCLFGCLSYIWMGPLWLPLTNSESRKSWKGVSGIAALFVLVAAGGVGLSEYRRSDRSRPAGRDDYDSSRRRASALPQEGAPLSRSSAPAASTRVHRRRATQEQRMLQLFGDEATVRLPHMTDR